jgi:multicomponent Na+:H+ antiporter subunit C
MVIADILGRLPFVLIVVMSVTGIAIAAGASNLLKRVAGLALLWASLILFYALTGVVAGGHAPILSGASVHAQAFSSPLPQALMLGAGVAGMASLVLGLALAVRVRESYGAAESADIAAADDAQDQADYIEAAPRR